MFKNNKAFSLVQVIVSAGILSALSLAFLQLNKNMMNTQKFAQVKGEEVELSALMRLILDDSNHCRLSFAGDGPLGSPSTPVVFKKSDIDQDNEGLKVSFYLSNQAGDARSLKKLNGADNTGGSDKSIFGNLKINSIKLIMNNGVGSNYAQSVSHNDLGKIRLSYEKKMSSNSSIRTKELDFNVSLNMSTNSSGDTTILGCGSINNNLTSGDYDTGRYAHACGSGNATRDVVFNKTFSSPPHVLIQPQWASYTMDEDSTWWVTNVTTTGFRVKRHGASSGYACHGENYFYWVAIVP